MKGRERDHQDPINTKAAFTDWDSDVTHRDGLRC